MMYYRRIIMSVRTRIIRRNRKEIMKLGKITRVEVLNKDDDGSILYPKNRWGYCVELEVNGHRITAPNDNWYMAWKGALDAARWASEQPQFDNTGMLIRL